MSEQRKPGSEKPICAGVFSALEGADKAVQGLLDAGFTSEQVTVVCSDAVKERHFKKFEHQDPAGTTTPRRAVAGGAIGATLGGLAAAVTIASTGGIALIAIGPLFAGAGAIAGGLVGAMSSRGVERELADYYDQAVVGGKILVAAEDHRAERLAEAERILAAAGAEPVELRLE